MMTDEHKGMLSAGAVVMGAFTATHTLAFVLIPAGMAGVKLFLRTRAKNT